MIFVERTSLITLRIKAHMIYILIFLHIERASTDIEHFKKYLILEHKSLGYV